MASFSIPPSRAPTTAKGAERPFIGREFANTCFSKCTGVVLLIPYLKQRQASSHTWFFVLCEHSYFLDTRTNLGFEPHHQLFHVIARVGIQNHSAQHYGTSPFLQQSSFSACFSKPPIFDMLLLLWVLEQPS